MARKRETKSILKKTGKESLNIKIPSDLNERLKSARKEARKQGFMFNVSEVVQEFLENKLKEVENELRKKNPKYVANQQDLDFSE